MKKLLIVFNGGSLREFNFNKINHDKYDVMIMGNAYRYFRKNNLSYDYYINVDDVCQKSNEWDICREIKQREGIFLLTKTTKWSDASVKVIKKNAHKVQFLEDHKSREHNPFYGLKKWTTGSSAILFGISLGYKRIHLIGLDNDYVEVLPETSELSNGTLTIDKPIVNNPNYFFDDYQRVGDVYNRPNNIPNLHTDSIIDSVNVAERENIILLNFNNKPSFKDNIKTKTYDKFIKS